ncbi:MAG: RNA polymerase sigma factor [Alistipes sp.]
MQISSNDINIDRLRDPATHREEFDRLIDRYTEPLYRHVRRLVVVHEDAEDVVQETFIRAYGHIGEFRGSAQELSAWLYRIATNTAFSALRHYKRGLFSSIDSPCVLRELKQRLMETCEPNTDAGLIRFQQVVLGLPLKQRLVFNLRYYDEMPYGQIARILNQKEESLKVNYHYAVRKIKEEMTK